jgi:ABC-2 type transport system permease protein
MMLVLIVYVFTASVYTAATAMPETLHNAPIAIVDEDNSPLSQRIASAFYPPQFTPPAMIAMAEMDAGMDAGLYTFVLTFRPTSSATCWPGARPAVQLNVDATRMSQAFTGSGYIQQIVTGEVNEFVQRYRAAPRLPVDLALRARFNPNAGQGLVRLGDADHQPHHHAVHHPDRRGADPRARARHHRAPAGDAGHAHRDHAFQGLVDGPGGADRRRLSLNLVVRGVLGVPIEGSVPLFFAGAALHLFATTSMGIFLATWRATCRSSAC